MKSIIIIMVLVLTLQESKACNVCGGGTNDIAVLALDGRMLFNVGYTFDYFTGTWNQTGKWTKSEFNSHQQKIAAAFAYRISRHLQLGFSLPYVINTSNLSGYRQTGSNLGDISLSARYEFFHEFQVKKSLNGKNSIDKKTPYLAITGGITVPTGKSEENAESEVDVTGKGYYMTSLGFSVIKTIIRNRFQLSADFSWQHCFSHKYDSYFGGPPAFETKKAGDKFNYSLTANYIFGSEHAVSVTGSGFTQNAYKLNDVSTVNSEERNVNVILAYTYYPHTQFRVTPSIKFSIPSDNIGRNAPGSTTFNINFTYYIPDYSIK